MKIFIQKVAIFSLLLLLVLQIPELFLPYYWANPGCRSKMPVYQQLRDDIDYIFLGSSRVYRQIDPKVFDQEIGDGSQSFNLGYSGFFNPEVYVFYENFLRRNEAAPGTTVFLELQRVQNISKRNLHTARSKYYLNLLSIMYVGDSIYSSKSLTRDEKTEMTREYFVSFLERVFKIDLLRPMVRSLVAEESTHGLGTDKCGFVPLRGNDSHARRLFLENPESLSDLRDSIESVLHSTELHQRDEVHFKKINSLIELSAAKGIHLILLLPPRLDSQKCELLLPIYEAIDVDHKLNLLDPCRFPELYSFEYSHDRIHLNRQGSTVFTKKLAQEFMALEEQP